MPDFLLEDTALSEGYRIIAGVDEAGRGPWAGPVVAGAAVIERDKAPDDLLAQLDDSKKLTSHRRAELLGRLRETPGVHLGLGEASVDEIDIHNILAATMLAMQRAVSALPVSPDLALIDGNREPILPCDLRTVVKGDAKSLSIAAASIVAKETRDGIMRELAKDYPKYGWETNAGYGTLQHQTALKYLGVTPHHRRSFKPIRKYLGTGF